MGGLNIFRFDSLMVDNNSSTIEYGMYQTQQGWAMLKTDGTAKMWGPNNYGGTSILGFESKLRNIKKIYANYYNFCILRDDGTAYPFGHYSDTAYGRLDFPTSNFSIMSQLTNVKKFFIHHTYLLP